MLQPKQYDELQKRINVTSAKVLLGLDGLKSLLEEKIGHVGRRILVCDDDPHIANILKIILEQNGHEVVIANDGFDCLETLMKNNIKLLIVDLQMPGLGGIDVLDSIKGSAFKKIVVTGSDITDDDIMAHNADAVIRKPFNLKEVIAKVNELLSGGAHEIAGTR